MLNGGGGLNPDGLSLDLQFAADKTLTARRGPTPTFTRASSGTFVGSNGLIQSAATNIPRFDHTSAGVCRGLLIEESGTNSCLQSENFGTTWSSVNLNQTGTPPYLNVATSPDGATTADKLIATTANAIHQFRQDVTLVGGASYTISVYFKAAETNFATISVVGIANGSVDWVAYFNISASSPAVGQFNGFASTSLVDVGNGWRRCSVTFTATASGNLNVRFGGASSANLNSNFYAGDGTSGFLLWGAQIEAGSFATSYIPTTTGIVVRSVDMCSIASISSFYAGLGTILVGSQFNHLTTGLLGVCGFNTSNTFQICVNRLQNNTRGFTFGATPAVTLNSASNLPSTTFVKSAFAFNTNDAAFVNNGVIGATSTSLTLPSVTQFQIGSNGGQPMQSGVISEIRYYRKRLPNAKLQSLTA